MKWLKYQPSLPDFLFFLTEPPVDLDELDVLPDVLEVVCDPPVDLSFSLSFFQRLINIAIDIGVNL